MSHRAAHGQARKGDGRRRKAAEGDERRRKSECGFSEPWCVPVRAHLRAFDGVTILFRDHDTKMRFNRAGRCGIGLALGPRPTASSSGRSAPTFAQPATLSSVTIRFPPHRAFPKKTGRVSPCSPSLACLRFLSTTNKAGSKVRTARTARVWVARTLSRANAF
jgi:hypothetical protein